MHMALVIGGGVVLLGLFVLFGWLWGASAAGMAVGAKAFVPVWLLVGSTISLPGPRRPWASASFTIEVPMRHLTEKAGLRPSILASTVAWAPSVTRLRRTSGVLPNDSTTLPPLPCTLSQRPPMSTSATCRARTSQERSPQ